MARPESETRSLYFQATKVATRGVDLSEEVGPRTMQSRLAPGCYFMTSARPRQHIGGYNFQAAFSTGALAGDAV